MSQNTLVYQNVRDAVGGRQKLFPMPVILMSCKTYCKAYKKEYDEPYCTAVIESLIPEPGEHYLRYLPEGFEMDPKLESVETFYS